MGQELIDYLTQESYLDENGQKTKDYTLFSEDFEQEEVLQTIRRGQDFLCRICAQESGETLSELEKFIKSVQEYENIQESFETGAYLQQVYLIKMKERCRELMEEKEFYPLLW